MMVSMNMLEAARQAGVERYLITSSSCVYPDGSPIPTPESAAECNLPERVNVGYGWAKRMAEMQIQAYQIQYGLSNFAIVRPCNVYGPGDNFDPANAMVIPSLMARIAAGENPLIVWGDGTAVRDFAYSDDVAEGIILALLKGTSGRYVNLGSGRGVSIRELVETLSRVTPFEFRFDATKSSGFRKRVMDVSLARRMLGYEPKTPLEEGLRWTWNWYLANREEYKLRKNYFTDAAPPAG